MWGAASFATYLIVCPTCFLLGVLFTNWPYDFPLLWTSAPITEKVLASIEDHYTILYNAPPLIPRILHFVFLLALCAFCLKLYNPSEANMLFDGASLALFMIAVVMYGTNIVKGMKAVDSRDYGDEVPRVDSLQVVAATNTICALVLVGVLTLQAGQWYAEKKEKEEIEKMRLEESAAAPGTAGGSLGKKEGKTALNGKKKKV